MLPGSHLESGLGRARAAIGGIAHANRELLRGDPLGEEVGRHVGVVELRHDDVALSDALLQRVVTPQEVSLNSTINGLSAATPSRQLAARDSK